MEVRELSPDLLGDLTSTWNRALAAVPHCYPVDEATFAAAVAGADQYPVAADRHPHPRGPFTAARTCVVLEGGRIVALATSALAPDAEGRGLVGAIRALWYERGHREAGQLVLDTALGEFRGTGVTRIDVFHFEHRLPSYHVEHAHLTDRLDHIHALLGANGFRPVDCEAVLDWPEFPDVTPAATPGLDFRLSLLSGPGRLPGIKLEALRGGEWKGICACASGGDSTTADAAQDWVYIAGLCVEEDLRGRGVGKALLLHALHEARRLGYRHAALCAHFDNYRALLLYGNLGFRAVDRTLAWRRLPDPDDDSGRGRTTISLALDTTADG